MSCAIIGVSSIKRRKRCEREIKIMEKRKEFIINCTYFAIILSASFLLIKFGLPLLAPFVIGFILAYFLKWPIRFVSRKLKCSRKIVAIVMVFLFYGTIGVFVGIASVKVFSTVGMFVTNLPQVFRSYGEPILAGIFTRLEHAVIQMDPTLLEGLDYVWDQFMQSLLQLVSKLSVSSMELISGIASSLPMLFIKLVLMIISTFFIAADYDKLAGFCMAQMSKRVRNVFIQIKQYVVGTLLVCIRSYLLIMSITFVELSLGLTVIRVENAILIALGIAIFDILPVLGTGGIMIPWAVIAAVLGYYPLALKLLVLYVVITIIRNIIEPKIVGSQIGLHPVLTLVSMFAGVQLLGVVGLFGFPILLSLFRYLNDTGTIHLYRRVGEKKEEENEY